MLAAAFLAAIPSTYAADTPPAPAGRPERKAAYTAAFAADLYAQLAGRSEGNLFFSPASINAALGMTYAGARGNTAAQMAKVLHYGNDLTKVSEYLSGLITTLNNHPEVADVRDDSGKRVKQPAYQLFLANALWGEQGFPFKPDFIRLVQRSYGGGLRNLDFIGQPEPARAIINEWVAKQTKDRIKNLIPEGAVTRMTRLVLTNAIYFKGDWQQSFRKAFTTDGPFQLSAEKSVDVPLMHQTGHFGYGENDDLQLLEIPYTQNELSMVVLLPKKADGLAPVEKNLTAENMNQWLRDKADEKVEVTLPKFAFTSGFQLERDLLAMGMTDAFDPGKADFSGMTESEHLFISKVIHKAFVAVDEEGTEAAAATAVMMPMAAAPGPETIKVFKADHPFIFLIRHNATDEILFLGRVVNPKGE
jgi:serpin B